MKEDSDKDAGFGTRDTAAAAATGMEDDGGFHTGKGSPRV